MLENPYPRKKGNYYSLLFYKNDPLITIGPDWCYYLFLFSVTLLSFVTIFVYLGEHLSENIILIGTVLYSLHFLSYLIAAFSNPGIPSNNNYKEYNKNPVEMSWSFIRCSQCKSLVNLDGVLTFHCRICNVCIEGYDHHCPWVTKCVGKGNICSFYIFVTSTLLYVLYLLYVITQMK